MQGMLRIFARACPVAVGVLLVSGLVTTAAGGQAAHAASASVLTKTVQDVTAPGANPANHGDTLSWVLSYTDNASGPGAAAVTDLLAGAPGAGAYVPGSLRVPANWTPSWSTNGTSFQPTDTGAATTAVRASNPAALPGGTSAAAALPAPDANTQTEATVGLTPSGFYCSGSAGLVQGYGQLSLQGINLADVDLASSTVTVNDPGGPLVAVPFFASDGTADLSGVSVTAHPTINVTAHLVLHNGSDFTGGNQPLLVASFRGAPPQICFRTTVSPTNCAVTGVLNQAGGTDATGTFTSNAASLPVAPGPNCQPHVTINKEICNNNANLSACGPGGSGPWSKKSTPGLLGLLGTAFWRITVTDAGPVDATQATLSDQAAPSCASAAGTFTVAAGGSKQFFCSTTLLLLPFTNTASASFIAANSPAGTKPTTTASSTATACSLLCILGAQQAAH